MSNPLPDDATLQQVFDHVLKALRKQGKASVDTQGNCFYRTPEGLKCAAGHCIPDDLYRPSFENESIDKLINSYSLVLPWMTSEHIPLMIALQSAHDIDLGHRITSWEKEMKKIAEKFGLMYKEPEQ